MLAYSRHPGLKRMRIKIVEKIMAANDAVATENRRLLDEQAVVALNVMGSPGAGKTSLIENTVRWLNNRRRVAVIEGDIATSYDAERIARTGVPVIQIATGGECHLDAAMIKQALADLDLLRGGILLIENVGNLVCPAEYDLGEHFRVVVASVPEGDDKIEKYPAIYRRADAVVVNKADLAEMSDFRFDRFRMQIQNINPHASLFELSCKTGEGLSAWADWIAQLGCRN